MKIILFESRISCGGCKVRELPPISEYYLITQDGLLSYNYWLGPKSDCRIRINGKCDTFQYHELSPPIMDVLTDNAFSVLMFIVGGIDMRELVMRNETYLNDLEIILSSARYFLQS